MVNFLDLIGTLLSLLLLNYVRHNKLQVICVLPNDISLGKTSESKTGKIDDLSVVLLRLFSEETVVFGP